MNSLKIYKIKNINEFKNLKEEKKTVPILSDIFSFFPFLGYSCPLVVHYLYSSLATTFCQSFSLKRGDRKKGPFF